MKSLKKRRNDHASVAMKSVIAPAIEELEKILKAAWSLQIESMGKRKTGPG
jgi:hypothetical protein